MRGHGRVLEPDRVAAGWWCCAACARAARQLTGSFDARVRQIMRPDGLDREGAERRVRANDRVRIGYVRNSYGVDPEDPGLYHLWIDSTALDVDTCVELIVTAASARIRRPAAAAADH
jgi:cytidylate kinase